LSATWLNDTRLLASVGRGEDTDVWELGLNGRGHELEWLTDSAKSMGVETERELVVSSDELTLLFSGEGSGEHHRNFLVDLRRHRLLTLSGDAEDAPSLSPNGREIAYQQVSRAGDWDLCVATISVQEVDPARCLRFPGGNDREPVFLPNGHELVFSSDRASRRSGVSSLYLLDLRTGSVRRLTPAGYDALDPAVTPSGQSVVFVRRALLPLR
jgi:dipeptidyl aminopeptidase/acylaminoacyl peptidase